MRILETYDKTKGQLRGKCFHLMTSSWQEVGEGDGGGDGGGGSSTDYQWIPSAKGPVRSVFISFFAVS